MSVCRKSSRGLQTVELLFEICNEPFLICRHLRTERGGMEMKMRGRHSVRPLPTIQQGTFSAISTAQPCRGMSPARAPHSLASDRHILARQSYGCNFFNEQAASCGRNSSEQLGPQPHSTPQPSASVWRGEESHAEMSPRM